MSSKAIGLDTGCVHGRGVGEKGEPQTVCVEAPLEDVVRIYNGILLSHKKK